VQASPIIESGASERGHVATLSEAIASLEGRFVPGGALGVLIVDASALRAIEREQGGAAYRVVFERLVERIRAMHQEMFGADALVAAGEAGHGQIVAFLLREDGGRTLLRSDLPALQMHVESLLEEQGPQLLGTPGRRLPPILVGSAVTLRHPRLWVVSQVRDLLERARADAELNLRLAARERRRSFLEVLLARRLRSVFEPIVSASNLTVFGYEALVRGPEDTPYNAAYALFGAAEEHDMVHELDALCCEAALQGAVGLPAQSHLFLNVRPTSLQDPRFAPDVMVERLASCGLAPSQIVFELSEQEAIGCYDSFRRLRETYRARGFQFALDDTGAGYASLEAVLEIRPEFIKVDRAFVRGIDQDAGRQAMFLAFREAARSVNARLIGEGLDRLEELQMLASLGIDLGQGWLFGRPTPLRARMLLP
jgi:EAL domain-containing protein (putative c-di-GMP-specific phosphodiesterase class I)